MIGEGREPEQQIIERYRVYPHLQLLPLGLQPGNLDLLVEGGAVHHPVQGAAGVDLPALATLHRQHLLPFLFQPGKRLLLIGHLPLSLVDTIGDRLPDDPVAKPEQQYAAAHRHQPLFAGADAMPPDL